jgi:hypothetical protein
MASFEGGERSQRLEIAGGNISVEILKELNEGVRIPLRMSGRIGRITASLWAHK